MNTDKQALEEILTKNGFTELDTVAAGYNNIYNLKLQLEEYITDVRKEALNEGVQTGWKACLETITGQITRTFSYKPPKFVSDLRKGEDDDTCSIEGR